MNEERYQSWREYMKLDDSEITRWLYSMTKRSTPSRLPGVPDIPIMQGLEMAIPLSPEEVKALNWRFCVPRHDPRRN